MEPLGGGSVLLLERVGLQQWFQQKSPNASWTWFVTVVFIMASRWHEDKWSPSQCES